MLEKENHGSLRAKKAFTPPVDPRPGWPQVFEYFFIQLVVVFKLKLLRICDVSYFVKLNSEFYLLS